MKLRILIKESVEQQHLFHCTHLWKVPSIIESGLQGGGESQFGSGYKHHSSGKVFLCDERGIRFWFGRMEDIANHNADFNSEEDLGWLPVCLRIQSASVKEKRVDDIGSRDSRENSWFVSSHVAPGMIEIWNGESWVSLEEADLERMLEIARTTADIEEDEDGMTIYANFDTFMPRG